jgi:hypothetical protein
VTPEIGLPRPVVLDADTVAMFWRLRRQACQAQALADVPPPSTVSPCGRVLVHPLELLTLVGAYDAVEQRLVRQSTTGTETDALTVRVVAQARALRADRLERVGWLLRDVLTPPAPPPAPTVETRICACGCGTSFEVAPASRRRFVDHVHRRRVTNAARAARRKAAPGTPRVKGEKTRRRYLRAVDIETQLEQIAAARRARERAHGRTYTIDLFAQGGVVPKGAQAPRVMGKAS